MLWSRLRCWNLHRQKILKLRPWIWKSNIFSHLHLQARIFVFTSCLNVWEWEKQILAHDIMMQKNPQTRVDILWIFTDFHRVLRAQSPSCTHHHPHPHTHVSFSNGISLLTVKSSIKFQKNFPTPAPPPLPKAQKCSYFSYFTFGISRNQDLINVNTSSGKWYWGISPLL